MVDEDGGSATEEAQDEWVYVGRYRSHSKPITGLEFGLSAEQLPLLVSVGEDRRLVEYNLQKTSVSAGIHLRAPVVKIEQSGAPTTCMWAPLSASAPEELVVTANDEYKVKQWNASNKMCRRTTLGPTYGGPMNRMIPLPADPNSPDGASEYVAYATYQKVVGLMQLPLDGNPNKSMGLIAHPGEVSAMAVTHDGRYMLTAGGADLTVNLWAVQTEALDETVKQGGAGIDPYLALIEGGPEGDFYNELVDYFYYAQLVSQGEDSTAPRESTGEVPLERIPDLMRALGYYPTEQEVQNMCSEVKYAKFTETGQTQESINLEDFIKLHVNHRPVFGIGKHQIEQAFAALGASGPDASLNWEYLASRLSTEGEPISEEKLKSCLNLLVGDSQLTGEISAETFADEVLGFVDAPAEEN